MLSTLILYIEVPEMTLLTRINNNVHARYANPPTLCTGEDWYLHTHENAYCTILFWVSEIFRIPMYQNKRQ